MRSDSGQTVATGRSLVRNVGANWIGMAVFMVSGFVLPRLISDSIGQGALGVWDFAWSIVSYTGLLSFGVASAGSRYVARLRAREDWGGLSRVVSTCLALLGAAFFVGIAALALFVLVTPFLLGSEKNTVDVAQAQLLVGILGFNAAIMLPLGLFSGILTGCQRFDLKNLTRVVCHGTGLAAMIVLLTTGRGLTALALASLAAELSTGILNIVIARRLCPQLRIAPGLVRQKDLWDVLRFGGKTLLQAISRMAVYQTSGLIVAFFLGPLGLAVYARQRALVMFATRLLNQYGNVFTPATSELQAIGDDSGLQKLAVSATRYGLYIALPLALVLMLAGGPIVGLWMGAEFEAQVVLAILAAGHLPSLASRGAYRILVGLDRHGRAGVAELFCSLLSVVLGLLFVGVFGMGLEGAAAAVAIALSIGAGLLPQMYLCRALRISIDKYVVQVLLGPMAAALPLLAMLLVAKFFFGNQWLVELAVGVGGGGLALGIVYWHFVLPVTFKNRLLSSLGLTRIVVKEARQEAQFVADSNR